MCIAESFVELHHIAERHVAEISSFQHQCRQLQCQPLPIDPLSVDLYPQDRPALQPVKIYGDGNCLARAGSFLAFGTEDEHVEIRMRIACELALHSDIYQDDSFLGAGLEDGQTA